MHEALWNLRDVKERREEMAKEMEEVRLAKSLRGTRGGLRGLVAGLIWDLRPRGSSSEGPQEARGSGEPCEENSQTTLA